MPFNGCATREPAEVNLHKRWIGWALLAVASLASAAHAAQSYVPEASTCDGYPRADIGMAEGLCAGLVMAPKEGAFRSRQIKTPRVLFQLDDAKSWLVTDLGGWTAGRGKIWSLRIRLANLTRLNRRGVGSLSP